MLIGHRWHTCGTKLAVTWKWNGLAYVLYLLNQEGSVATSRDCPGCGEYIYTGEFLLEPPKGA